jgi:23S rRNA pseudouridine1911/1915/1917 synthase
VLEILYEDNHLLAVNKPAMLPTMGVGEGVPSLLEAAKDYVRTKYSKPGNVYLGIVSRLDAPVTGVVLLARTSKAAGRLSEQFREREVEKLYWAIVEGHIAPAEGTLINFMRKDERHRKMHVTGPNTPNAQRAELSYRAMLGTAGEPQLKSNVDGTSVEVRLHTGRKHQIRVQLSHAGFPIVGDCKYGGSASFSPGIALHSRRLVVEHPVSKMQIAIEAPLPPSWKQLVREI